MDTLISQLGGIYNSASNDLTEVIILCQVEVNSMKGLTMQIQSILPTANNKPQR